MSPLAGFVGSVELANPAGLWALALLVPVVLLHLYRRRRRRVEVAFLPLLRETAGATSAQGAWRNVHETASLLLRCAALVAAALALAGPRPALAGPPPKDLVLVIDADVTTRAIEERPGQGCVVTRFAKEVELAKALLAAQGEGRTAIVLAGEAVDLRAGFGDDAKAALDAVGREFDGRGRADLRAAVRLATGVPSGRSRRIVVITSRALPDGLPADVEAMGAGSASEDQGIVDQSVEASPDGVHRTVRLVLHNFTGRPARRGLTGWMEEGKTAFEKVVDLPAGTDVPVAFEVRPPHGGGSLRVRLDGADAFPADDRSGAWLAPTTRPTVLVAHAGAPRAFVTAVLDAMGDAIDREGSGFVAVSGLLGASPRDVTIFDGVAPPVGLPPTGGWIFLAPFGAPGAMTFPFAPGRSVKQPLVWRSKADHPLLRGVDLSATYVARATTIAAPAAEPLAFAEGEPVLAEGTAGAGGRWIAFGLDPEGSDLPLRAALPVLLRNAIRRLGTAPTQMLKPFYRPGEVVRPRLEVPELTRGAVLVLVDMDRFALVADADALVRAEEIRACGDQDFVGPPMPAGPTPAAGRGMALPGGRGEPVAFSDGTAEYYTAFVDLSRDYDITPARPAARPPPPAPPAPDREAGARLWRAILVAAAAALLLADLLLLALRGSADRRGKVAATPVTA